MCSAGGIWQDSESQMGISDAFGYFIFAGGGSIFGKCQELQPEHMQAIKKADNQPSVNWKLVSQEINEKNEYVYDGDKTDDTMSDRVLPKISDGSWGYAHELESTGNSICQCSKSCRLVA